MGSSSTVCGLEEVGGSSTIRGREGVGVYRVKEGMHSSRGENILYQFVPIIILHSRALLFLQQEG